MISITRQRYEPAKAAAPFALGGGDPFRLSSDIRNLPATTRPAPSVVERAIARVPNAFYAPGRPPSYAYAAYVVPQWLPIALLTLPPIIKLAIVLIRRLARRRRRGRGLCGRCGYDLRGNESGTCPECGTAATPLTLAPA
jgi:hypothetical protein